MNKLINHIRSEIPMNLRSAKRGPLSVSDFWVIYDPMSGMFLARAGCAYEIQMVVDAKNAKMFVSPKDAKHLIKTMVKYAKGVTKDLAMRLEMRGVRQLYKWNDGEDLDVEDIGD